MGPEVLLGRDRNPEVGLYFRWILANSGPLFSQTFVKVCKQDFITDECGKYKLLIAMDGVGLGCARLEYEYVTTCSLV